MKTSTIRKFRKHVRQFERLVDAQNNLSCCCGVTLPQCHVLMELLEHPASTINQLADALGLDKSTISRTVESLVKDGLVNREIPKENRRISKISLSEKGTAICLKINRDNDKFWKNALIAFPDDEQEAFLKLFEIFVENLKQKNENKNE